jgi:N-acetylglucosamine-6-phosphate deacetylase
MASNRQRIRIPRAASHVLAACRLTATIATAGAVTAAVCAQEPPPVAMRESDVRRDAIVDVTLVPRPGVRVEHATVVMRDGWIEAAGPKDAVKVPEGTTVHDGRGMVAYPGFIDACVRLDSATAARGAAAQAGAHWNGRVTPQVRAADLATPAPELRKELRALGFTTAAFFPSAGIFRGSGHVALLGDEPRTARTILADAGTAVAFEHAGEGDWDRATYPGALIGAIALVRQTFADAAWHAACTEVWRAHPEGNRPPETATALDALAGATRGAQRTWFDAGDEKMLGRAAAVAAEFRLDAGYVGSGREYRRLDDVRALGRPVVVPFDFPKAPDVATPWAADDLPLRDLEHWALAPTNLAQLLRAGVPAAASTVRLKDKAAFAKAAERTVQCGTTEDELLAALTVNPAKALGIGAIAGTVEPGRLANLVIAEGPLFGKDFKVRGVWVGGVRHDVDPRSRFPLRGTYALAAPGEGGGVLANAPVAVTVDPDSGRVEFAFAPAADGAAAGAGARDAAKKARAKATTFEDARGGFTVDGRAFGVEGTLRGAWIASGDGAQLALVAPDGRRATWPVKASARTGDAPKADEDDGGDGAKPDGATPASTEAAAAKKAPFDPKPTLAAIPRTLPLGDFGVGDRFRPRAVLVHDATVWTVAKDGILEHADVLAVDGKVVAVGKDLRATLPAGTVPADVHVIEAAGKHVTPGLIDCHSHTGIDGGVNEWTQNVTSEVRIADAIDPDDVGWYRQLAGGLTAANQLHGSANPIGGQNSVVKLKWGHPAADFPIAGAPGGIKFALGENVTRSKKRYPSSRLGVEQLLRDRFQSAREHAAALERHAKLSTEERARTMPPRPDLELQALAEILAGARLVHCHSYRQDEIMMLLRVAQDFGFRVATLQHVLEGYKVAAEIAAHGAGASSFSDWWAYKVEVMDAIPWNGQMLHDAGVVTSFNSDSDELARRMNTEAAKAMRYGGLPREEAIKFVTLNPARQLRIDDRVGSLESGKDADFVVWSADPLSVYARCEQTWIDGERMFDLASDAAMRTRDEATRRSLVAMVLADPGRAGSDGKGRGGPGEEKPSPDGPPTDARAGTLLARMRALREDAVIARIRSGLDPAQARQGECGCSDADIWAAIFEETAGAGGNR